MYGILGEDTSDVDTLDVLVRRLQEKHQQAITKNFKKGHKGCGELLNNGWRTLDEWQRRGCTRFIVAQDADQKDTNSVRDEISQKIIRRSIVKASCVCVVVPVQEIEAWLLADLSKAINLFSGWKPENIASPETITKPKEHLEKLSRQANGKPRYKHATDNSKLAEYVDLDLVSKRCQSFKPLENLIMTGTGNL